MRRSSARRGETLRGMLACALLTLIFMSGCGGGPVDQLDSSTETGAINLALSKLVDAATSARLADELFVKASLPKPAELAKYGKFAAYVPTETQIDGDTAKLKVEIYGTNGTVVATQDWTMSKADGTWKIQSAPLPAK